MSELLCGTIQMHKDKVSKNWKLRLSTLNNDGLDCDKPSGDVQMKENDGQPQSSNKLSTIPIDDLDWSKLNDNEQKETNDQGSDKKY